MNSKAKTIAGTGTRGHKDGKLLEAQITEISGIAVHEDMIYLADTTWVRAVNLTSGNGKSSENTRSNYGISFNISWCGN